MTATLEHSDLRRVEFWAGVKATLPMVVGAIPFGIIFGAVAVNSGLSAWATAAMSAFVFAGSSQFVAAGLVANGAGIGIIVLTTFVVNLRHSLYAATLAPHVRHLSQRWLLPLGFTLTDETFVVVAERYSHADSSPHRHWFYLGSSVIMYLNWQVCTWIGIVAGQSLPNPAGWGLDFALVVTFIGMLMPGLRTRPIVVCSAAAGATALLAAGLPNQLWLIVAALAGVGAGVVAERLQQRGAP
ncbi:MAG: AzlC family ABC transporter permease [Caldilineaceae bacterium]|nr:AzlC family ABC transporter permease [Caldilineaceae bacterium]